MAILRPPLDEKFSAALPGSDYTLNSDLPFRPPRMRTVMGNKKKAVAPIIPAKTEPLSEKEYQQALRKLHVELVKLQRWVVHKGLKICIVFEGSRWRRQRRHHQSDNRTRQPAGFPRRRPARANRARTQPALFSALYQASSRRRRNSDFRSQLVQPGRR